VGGVVTAGAQARNEMTRTEMTTNVIILHLLMIVILLKYNLPQVNHCKPKLHRFQADQRRTLGILTTTYVKHTISQQLLLNMTEK